MVPYYGDFAEDATVYIPFNTFDSNDPAASVTITNLADYDVKVLKNGSIYEVGSGGTGTGTGTVDGASVTIDHGGVVGTHLITIDTSVDAEYVTGADYSVKIEGTTVDAGTINAWVGSFSIENRTANIKAIDDNAAAATKLAASADEIYIGTVDTVTNTHTPTTTEFQADDITEATSDHWNGRRVIFTSGALTGQGTNITDYQAVGGIGQFTVATMTEAPANDDTFIIV